jgi:hypothetical protein
MEEPRQVTLVNRGFPFAELAGNALAVRFFADRSVMRPQGMTLVQLY